MPRELPTWKWTPEVLPFLLFAGVCGLSMVLGKKPWRTHVFDKVESLRDIPLGDYIHAGLWYGLAAAGVISLLLALTGRWWGGRASSPAGFSSQLGGETMPRGLFRGLLGFIVLAAAWRAWPGMTHSFWGDENWAFGDFVYGKWLPAVKGTTLQDPIRFHPVTWAETVFGDTNANNQWSASILQRLALSAWRTLTGREPWAFSETVTRLPGLAAGLGSLVALACWLRREGAPRAGLLAAALMSVHPWLPRFSTEARGYSLMLLFLALTLRCLSTALARGRRRDWLWFGLAQFAVIYSWKGAVYPLALLNAATGLGIWKSKASTAGSRLTAAARWMAANAIGAMLFLPLNMPSQLQVLQALESVRGRARPMDAQWAHDVLTAMFCGIPWHQRDALNPVEQSVERLGGAGSVAVWLFFAFATVGLVTGLIRLWRRSPLLGSQVLAVLLAVPLMMWHFKYRVRVELLPWYLLFTLPFVSMLWAVAVGLPRRNRRVAADFQVPESLAKEPLPGAEERGVESWGSKAGLLAGLAVLAGAAAFNQKALRNFQEFPKENYRGAVELTRWRHEAFGYSGSSKIRSAWLWRFPRVYDSRGISSLRDLPALRAAMETTRREDGEFYMVVGFRTFVAASQPEMLALLRNPDFFEPLGILWGQEPVQTLEVFHMKKKPPAAVSSKPAPDPAGA